MAKPNALGPALAVAALLVLAAALRLWGLGEHALWHDELVSLTRSQGHRVFPKPPTGVELGFMPVEPMPDEGVLSVVMQSRDISPPLYFLALRGWRAMFGSSAVAMRSLSVLVSTATVLAGALLAATLVGRRAGLVAGLLLALSPLEWRYAQEARPYALLGAFATISTLALVKLLSGHGRRGLLWPVYLLSTAGLIATHYTGAIVPVVHLAWCLYAGRSMLARLPRSVILVGLLLVAMAGWLLVRQDVVSRVERLLTRDFMAPIAGTSPEADKMAGRARVPYNAMAFGGGFISGLQSSPIKAAPHALLVAALILFGLRSGKQVWLVFLLAIAGPLALLILDTALGSRSLTIPRYAYASSPFVWVAAGFGLVRLRGWPFALALLLVAAGEVDGTVRARFRQTLSDDIALVAAEMNAAGCDERDLVISVLSFPEQVMELNQFLIGQPAELVVGDDLAIDEACLQQPWRHVFLLVVDHRAVQGGLVRERLAERFDERQSRALENLAWGWFTARPPGVTTPSR